MSNPRNLSDLVQENNLPEIKRTIKKLKDESRGYLKREDKLIIATAVRDAILSNKIDIVRSIMEEKLHIADRQVPIENKKHSEEKPLIYFAVKSKSLPMVKILVEAKASVKKEGSNGNGTNDEGIRTAVVTGAMDIVEFLLEQGALANGIVDTSEHYNEIETETYLGIAANNQDHEIAKDLLKYGASMENAIGHHNERFRDRLKRVHDKQSEIEAYQRSTKFLLDYAMGINFNSHDYNNLDFLRDINIAGFNFLGLSLDGKPITKEILRSQNLIGADQAITTLDELKEMRPSHRKTVIQENLEIAYKNQGKFVKSGIVNLVSIGDAIKANDQDAVGARLKAGVSPNLKCKLGLRSIFFDTDDTLPILLAVLMGNMDIIKLLVEHPDFDKGSLTRAVLSAQQLERADIAKYLNELKDINQQDQHGNTALHFAAHRGDVQQVKECIKKNADLNLPNKEGETALSIVAGHCKDRKYKQSFFGGTKQLSSADIEIMRLLLEAKADANIGKADNPLNLAAKSGSYEAMKLLLPVTIKKNYEYSRYPKPKPIVLWYVPLMFDSCGSKNWLDILVMLETFQADLTQKGPGNMTLLMELLGNIQSTDKDFTEYFQQIEFLLSHGVDPNAKNDRGLTAWNILSQNLEESDSRYILLADLLSKYSKISEVAMDETTRGFNWLI